MMLPTKQTRINKNKNDISNVFLTQIIVFSSKILILLMGIQVLLWLFIWVHARLLDVLMLPEMREMLSTLSHWLRQANLLAWVFYWLAMMAWNYVALYNTQIIKRKNPYPPNEAISGFLIPILFWVKPYRIMAYLGQIWTQNANLFANRLRWAWGLWVYFSVCLNVHWIFGMVWEKRMILRWTYDLVQWNLLLVFTSSALSAFLFAKMVQTIQQAQWDYFEQKTKPH